MRILIAFALFFGLLTGLQGKTVVHVLKTNGTQQTWLIGIFEADAFHAYDLRTVPGSRYDYRLLGDRTL